MFIHARITLCRRKETCVVLDRKILFLVVEGDDTVLALTRVSLLGIEPRLSPLIICPIGLSIPKGAVRLVRGRFALRRGGLIDRGTSADILAQERLTLSDER